MTDVQNIEDIKIFVDQFYLKIQQDDLLSIPFASKIKEEDWPKHLNRMYTFWNTVLFAQKGYSGNPFSKHADLDVEEKHFKQWVKLFHETIDENFIGEVAEDAKSRAFNMAMLFHAKLKYLKDNPNHKSIV